jgi:preprotein translocase subunit SecG
MQLLNIFHVLIAIALVVFVLIQKGQGATAGAAFGSGASGTVFGSRGAGNFLSRTTWVLAALFCAISLTMAILVSRMMDAPETGLGVIADSQPEAALVETLPAAEEDIGDSLFNAEEPAPDVPAFEPMTDETPAVDSATGETPIDDLPPVESGEGRPGTTGNG